MRNILTAIILLSLFCCKGEFASSEIQSSYESVMKVHDEVMPEMSTINKLQRKLKKLDLQDPKVMELKSALQSADDGMMDWMHDFKLDRKAPKNSQLDYLQKEQQKIDKVSDDMKTSIANAQAYLDAQK